MKHCTLKAAETLIHSYIEKGGEATIIQEGILGLGTVLLHPNGNTLKTIVVKEIPLNEWSSAHTIRMYNKIPSKYKRYI